MQQSKEMVQPSYSLILTRFPNMYGRCYGYTTEWCQKYIRVFAKLIEYHTQEVGQEVGREGGGYWTKFLNKLHYAISYKRVKVQCTYNSA